MSEPQQPLEFFQTKDLIDELRRRFDDAIFVGYQEKTNTISDYVMFLQGSHHGVLGLMGMAMQAAEKTVHDDTTN
jgi:hypothetical protein